MNRFQRLELDSLLQQQSEAQAQVQQPAAAFQETDWATQAEQSRRAGQYEGALRFYSRALELDRSRVACWVGQVQMLVQLTEYPEAELWARKALELFKSNADLLSGRAQALCRAADIKPAQISSDAALAQPGQSAYGWMVRGELMLARRDSIEARCFEKALQIDADWLARVEVGRVYLHYRMPAKALAHIRQAVEQAPEQVFGWYEQAACEAELGLTAAARKSLGRCLELSPGHTDARRAILRLDGSGGAIRSVFRRLFRRS